MFLHIHEIIWGCLRNLEVFMSEGKESDKWPLKQRRWYSGYGIKAYSQEGCRWDMVRNDFSKNKCRFPGHSPCSVVFRLTSTFFIPSILIYLTLNPLQRSPNNSSSRTAMRVRLQLDARQRQLSFLSKGVRSPRFCSRCCWACGDSVDSRPSLGSGLYAGIGSIWSIIVQGKAFCEYVGLRFESLDVLVEV